MPDTMSQPEDNSSTTNWNSYCMKPLQSINVIDTSTLLPPLPTSCRPFGARHPIIYKSSRPPSSSEQRPYVQVSSKHQEVINSAHKSSEDCDLPNKKLTNKMCSATPFNVDRSQVGHHANCMSGYMKQLSQESNCRDRNDSDQQQLNNLLISKLSTTSDNCSESFSKVCSISSNDKGRSNDEIRLPNLLNGGILYLWDPSEKEEKRYKSADKHLIHSEDVSSKSKYPSQSLVDINFTKQIDHQRSICSSGNRRLAKLASEGSDTGLTQNTQSHTTSHNFTSKNLKILAAKELSSFPSLPVVERIPHNLEVDKIFGRNQFNSVHQTVVDVDRGSSRSVIIQHTPKAEVDVSELVAPFKSFNDLTAKKTTSIPVAPVEHGIICSSEISQPKLCEIVYDLSKNEIPVGLSERSRNARACNLVRDFNFEIAQVPEPGTFDEDSNINQKVVANGIESRESQEYKTNVEKKHIEDGLFETYTVDLDYDREKSTHVDKPVSFPLALQLIKTDSDMADPEGKVKAIRITSNNLHESRNFQITRSQCLYIQEATFSKICERKTLLKKSSNLVAVQIRAQTILFFDDHGCLVAKEKLPSSPDSEMAFDRSRSESDNFFDCETSTIFDFDCHDA